MKNWAGSFVIAAGLLGVSPAWADPRLDEKVYSPYVENQVLELETYGGGEIGGGALKGAHAYVAEAEYGLNDRLSLALVGRIAGGAGEATAVRGAGFEAVYYAGQIPGLGVDVGLYGEFQRGLHGDSDGLEGKILLAKQAGRFQGLLNLIVERPLHAPDEAYASYGYAASATWRLAGAFRAGVEAFGDLGSDHGFLTGRQGAYVGPVAAWEFHPRRSPVELEFNAGWLKSVGPARAEADSQLRFTVEVERRF